MRILKWKKENNDSGMTPMIDVVFLLLIFFMCATEFKVPDYRMDAGLPKDRGIRQKKSELQPLTDLRITIRKKNGQNVEFVLGRDVVLEQDNLTALIKQHYRELCLSPQAPGRDIPAIIDGEPDIGFGFVVQVFHAQIFSGPVYKAMFKFATADEWFFK